ncbi:MAG: iron-containing alcohol dehydrogenase, partial [Bacillota bacterium]
KRSAREYLVRFKGDTYAFGVGIMDEVGRFAAEYGTTAMLVASESDYVKPIVDKVMESLKQHGVALVPQRIVPNAAPNAPREDVYRIESYILHFNPDVIVAIGGGSNIDAVKAANALAALGTYSPEIDTYFGTGEVTKALRESGRQLKPLIAVQTASSSAAHLTKYSNVTDPVAGQKKLIVDDAIVPQRAVFDYSVTVSMPAGFTLDGALDGVGHCLEVYYGVPEAKLPEVEAIALCGIELVVKYLKQAVEDPNDMDAREALGLATDLGGYAIMVGGTNGAHLTSFSLVDVASHGRAVAIMNPYYTVFFAPAIEDRLRAVGDIYSRYGFIDTDLSKLSGRELGIAVAEGMVAHYRSIGFPTKLSDLDGFSDEHVKRALTAAKDPQLDMKLKNMPVPLNSSLVDEYMAPILEAAKTGDFSLIKTM